MIFVHRQPTALALLLVAFSVGTSLAQAQTDPLPSWNDGTVKKSITDFVTRVVTQGAPEFVPPAERDRDLRQRRYPVARAAGLFFNFSSRWTALTRWRPSIRNGREYDPQHTDRYPSN
jgi:hypothetical protein